MRGNVEVSSIDLAREPDIRVGDTVISPSTREIIAGDVRETLQPRVMQVLVALARRRGEVVSRRELMETCWGGRVVGEAVIYRCIAEIRRLAEKYRAFALSTVSRVGYRLEGRAAASSETEEPRAPNGLARQAPLVGRKGEMRALHESLAMAIAGRGSMALLAGEPGIGKTRMCKEAATQAAAAGALTLWGHSFAAPAGEPYGPLIEILEEIARAWPAPQFRELMAADAPQLARLLPELRTRFDDIPAESQVALAQARRLLINALAGVLERLSAAKPLVLIFDDLHWVDDETALVLRHLASRIADAPILVVGTYRDVQRDMGRPFADLIEECLRQRTVEEVQLGGLSEADTAELVVGLTGRPFARGRLVGPDPPSAQVGVIHNATRGNPFFIEEAVRHLAGEGRLYDANGNVRINILPEELAVTDGMRLVINRRVERLSLTARGVVTAAAVIGARFAAELLEHMDWGEDEGVLDALGEAELAGLIQRESGGYRFAHDLIRQAVLDQIPSPRLRRLHGRVAAAIGRLWPDAASERAVELGHHLARADPPEGDRAETINRLRRAGDLATAANDYEEAFAAYTAALALLPPGRTPARADLLAARTEPLGRLESRAETRDRVQPYNLMDDIQEAVSIHAEGDDADALARTTLRVTHAYWMSARPKDGLAACHRALARLGDRQTGDRATLLAWQGLFLTQLRDHAAGEASLNEAERLAVILDDPLALAWVGFLRATIHLNLDETRDVAVWALRGAEAARRSSNPDFAGPNLVVAGGALLRLGRWDEALAAADEAESITHRIGGWHNVVHCQFIRGAIVGAREVRFADDFDRTYIRKARGLGLDASAARALVTGLMQSGRWEEAKQAYEQALQSEDRDARVVAWSGLVLLNARLGDRDGAETMLAERWSSTDSRPRYERRLAASWGRDFAIAEALALLGRVEEAGRFYEVFLEYSRRNGPIERLLGITAAAAGRWAEVEVYFTAVLAAAERLPDLFALAGLRVDWARALLRRSEPGDQERAERLLGEAVARYESMAMRRHAAEACGLMAEALRQGAGRSASP